MKDYKINTGIKWADDAYSAASRMQLRDRIDELDKARRAAAHEPDCKYWEWDWRYSWHSSDCSCKRIAELKASRNAAQLRNGEHLVRIAELEAELRDLRGELGRPGLTYQQLLSRIARKALEGER